MVGVYTITNIINNKIYVGQSINIKLRLNQHKSDLKTGRHPNIFLQRAWNKYGSENFLFEVLVECEEIFLYSEENYWCNTLNATNKDFGYNLRSTSNSIQFRHSIDSKRKMSESRKGRIPWNKNKKGLVKFSDESKKRLSEIIRAQFRDGTRSKIYKISDEKRLLMSERAKNQDHSLLYTKEAILKRSGVLHPGRKEVYQYDLEGNFLCKFITIREASKAIKRSHGNISSALTGKQKTCGGYQWFYEYKGNKL